MGWVARHDLSHQDASERNDARVVLSVLSPEVDEA
jgi:hypothetical protein